MNASLIERLGLGALLCAWLIYGANFLGDVMVSVDHSAVAGGHGEATHEATTEKESEPEADFATLLASADPAAGGKVFGKCKSCHTIEAGGANGVGPNLANVVGRPKASVEGFSYSSALSEIGGEWTYEALNEFLQSPKGFANGTKMSFAGLSKPDQRAEVIAYLRENTASPPSLPEPVQQESGAQEAAEAQAEAAPEVQPESHTAAATPDAAGASESAAAASGGGSDLTALLAAGDAESGAKVFRKCKACHSVEQDGKNKVGPNLWNVVGGPVAHKEGFNYSDALAGLGGEWTYETLDVYLTDPKAYAPGNKMSFAGLKKPEDRADVILYLRDHADSPPPLP